MIVVTGSQHHDKRAGYLIDQKLEVYSLFNSYLQQYSEETLKQENEKRKMWREVLCFKSETLVLRPA